MSTRHETIPVSEVRHGDVLTRYRDPRLGATVETATPSSPGHVRITLNTGRLLVFADDERVRVARDVIREDETR